MSVIAATLARLDAATDGQLLGRFVQSRDPDAFASLVRRLGPSVLAVCRRVCPDSHLAEDAFQAAFLILARKAESVHPREQVAVWLHGVAYRTACKARDMLASRRRREAGSAELPDPPAPDPAVPDDDELRKLDAAIAALPEHLRAAVVLCELDGRSRKDAAKQLGIPEGTLSSRLAEARKRLGERLRPTAAVVTAALAASTAEAAVSGSTSETVKSLARGVMSMMLLNKLKLPAVVSLALAAVVLAAPMPTARVSAAPVPKEETPELKWKLKKGDVFYVRHEADTETRFTPPPNLNLVTSRQKLVTTVWKVTVAADQDGLTTDVEVVSCEVGQSVNGKAMAAEAPDTAGCKVRVTFDAALAVKKVEGGEELDKAVGQSGAMSADATARWFQQTFQVVPGKPIVNGGGWERKGEHANKAAALVVSRTVRAKVSEVKGGVAKVGTETDVTVKSDPKADPPGSVDIKSEKNEGTFWFNTRTGRLDKFEDTFLLTGMTQGGAQPFPFTEKTRHTTTMSDKPFKDE